MRTVVIGIQARSTSTRLPNKISELLGKKPIIQHVVDACQNAAMYLNNWSSKNIFVQVVVLIPVGDPIRKALPPELQVIEGHEFDVLSRYMMIFAKHDPDFVCRITADCPLIPSFIISKHIQTAVMNDYDYISNVDERCRTAPDGFDCEVISKRAMLYAHQEAHHEKDREHVTTYLRSHPPSWFRQGIYINWIDQSDLKLSVDTENDLNLVRRFFDAVFGKLGIALRIYGRHNVHRY